MRQLKYNDIPTVRMDIAQEQHGLCCLCNHIIKDPVLDHNHSTGLIRGVLCRGCNSLLGKIENSMAIYGLTDENKLRTFLNNIIDYRNSYYEMIHPKHATKLRKKAKKSTKKGASK